MTEQRGGCRQRALTARWESKGRGVSTGEGGPQLQGGDSGHEGAHKLAETRSISDSLIQPGLLPSSALLRDLCRNVVPPGPEAEEIHREARAHSPLVSSGRKRRCHIPDDTRTQHATHSRSPRARHITRTKRTTRVLRLTPPTLGRQYTRGTHAC